MLLQNERINDKKEDSGDRGFSTREKNVVRGSPRITVGGREGWPKDVSKKKRHWKITGFMWSREMFYNPDRECVEELTIDAQVIKQMKKIGNIWL